MLGTVLVCTVLAGSAQGGPLDQQVIEEIVDKAKATHSSGLVILQNGQVIVNENWNGMEDVPVSVQSVSKSMLALALGLLVDDGTIGSVDVPVAQWFPEWSQDALKKRITLRHLLTHRSGIPNDSFYRMQRNTLDAALSIQLVAKPGEKFIYSDPGTQVLAGVIAKASGMSVFDLLRIRIFNTLGIHEARWLKDKAGNICGAGGLALRPRDLARIGQLLLDEGAFRAPHSDETVQLISKKWIHWMTHLHVSEGAGYGALWWKVRENAYGVGVLCKRLLESGVGEQKGDRKSVV